MKMNRIAVLSLRPKKEPHPKADEPLAQKKACGIETHAMPASRKPGKRHFPTAHAWRFPNARIAFPPHTAVDSARLRSVPSELLKVENTRILFCNGTIPSLRLCEAIFFPLKF
jgi:hypothetical protein